MRKAYIEGVFSQPLGWPVKYIGLYSDLINYKILLNK
tara:strand:- start:465 stop:575 length:111 start_codon:yes stop_codon:yes gene_type:complete